MTDHAAPAVVLYNATLSLQSVSWILLSKTAVKDKLYKSEAARVIVEGNEKYGYYAFILYTLFTILAIWFPLAIAIITIMTWLYWLVWGINMKQE